MRTDRRFALAAAAAVVLVPAACVLFPRSAAAFCRTTTCPLPSDFSPSPGSCAPPNFLQYCQHLMPPVNPLPLWWRNHCVSYDLHEDAAGMVSGEVATDVATQIAAESFSKWTGTVCDGSTGARVSIDVRDLGPVSCDEVNYNSDQPNQHVIIFRDNGFEDGVTVSTGAPASANTLGLTTVTFNPDTGELYDADIEINSSTPLATGQTVTAGSYDLQSILTHEAGHFLGLAHSGDTAATMFAQYTPGSTSKRILSDDDMAGICAIYPSDGTRNVDSSVSASGSVAEDACDPTPRHGFQSACTSPQTHGCDVGHDEPPPGLGFLGLAVAAAIGGAARRRQPRLSEGQARA
jgi:MYXO-CTERM domain-containing protein